nr:translation initiation factor IF-2-like [Equus asinus]
MELSSIQARLALLLTHLTDERERLRLGRAATPGHTARGQAQAFDSSSRSLTAGSRRGRKAPSGGGVVETLGAPKELCTQKSSRLDQELCSPGEGVPGTRASPGIPEVSSWALDLKKSGKFSLLVVLVHQEFQTSPTHPGAGGVWHPAVRSGAPGKSAGGYGGPHRAPGPAPPGLYQAPSRHQGRGSGSGWAKERGPDTLGRQLRDPRGMTTLTGLPVPSLGAGEDAVRSRGAARRRGGRPGPRSRVPRALPAPGARFSGKECLARRGGGAAPPARASFIAAPQPGAFRQPGCSPGPGDSPSRPAAAPAPGRPSPDGRPKLGGVSKGGRVRAPLPAGSPPPRPAPRPLPSAPLPAPPPRPPARSLPSPLHNSKACVPTRKLPRGGLREERGGTCGSR